MLFQFLLGDPCSIRISHSVHQCLKQGEHPPVQQGWEHTPGDVAAATRPPRCPIGSALDCFCVASTAPGGAIQKQPNADPMGRRNSTTRQRGPSLFSVSALSGLTWRELTWEEHEWADAELAIQVTQQVPRFGLCVNRHFHNGVVSLCRSLLFPENFFGFSSRDGRLNDEQCPALQRNREQLRVVLTANKLQILIEFEKSVVILFFMEVLHDEFG